MRRSLRAILSLTLVFSSIVSFAQTAKKDFAPAADSLSLLLKARTTVDSPIKIDRVLKRGNQLDFYFSPELKDFPWRKGDEEWFRKELKEHFPDEWKSYTVGRIYTGNQVLSAYILPAPGNNGKPSATKFTYPDPRGKSTPFVEAQGADEYNEGLSGRIIALWQSHGKYYEESTDRWEWQRAATHRTVEDIYTQSYVLPFLMPMLENAGAYIISPRERDTQIREIITDNDPSFERSGSASPLVRTTGKYSETGKWTDAGTGFADVSETYLLKENPFLAGTARKAATVSQKKDGYREARWTAEIEESGEYSVYVSYKTLANSSESAHYTIHHAGGSSDFLVNQKMGGGTWVYLGTFPFLKGGECYVTLDNVIPEGRRGEKNSVVTADAVKIGGGMGKIARGRTAGEAELSGLPSYDEGALYWMQWAGLDFSILKEEWRDDYTMDFAGRGAWTSWMAGGSSSNPSKKGKGIPVDLSLAFHSDAGVASKDTIIGTLAIYTRMDEGKSVTPGGKDRMTCRGLADIVQTQVCEDIRKDFNEDWSRRMLWDKSYSECRTTGVPGMILEILSHQNLEDMKYGLDPSFRFTVSRAVYKGILKFLSNLYGCNYVVQPLPVRSFSTRLNGRSTVLEWKPGLDDKEPTAIPEGYIVYTRQDEGVFDKGIKVSGTSVTIPIEPGHIYSFKVVAWNRGGKSFPSEILSTGIPVEVDRNGFNSNKDECLVINNFTRVAAPTWIDGDDYAGFNGREESGAGYISEISYLGENYEFRRNFEWTDDDNPGFGASSDTHSGTIIPGNTFDYTYIHGKALMKCGYAFSSTSVSAFSERIDKSAPYALDIICGKQLTTPVDAGNIQKRYVIFPQIFRDAIKRYAADGTNILISGAYIGTDAWDSLYPDKYSDLEWKAEMQRFIKETLGYQWITSHGTNPGMKEKASAEAISGSNLAGMSVEFDMGYNDRIYPLEHVDGIAPATKEKSSSIMRYSDTRISAAILFDAGTYKAVSFGFPLEAITDEQSLTALIGAALNF